MEQHRRQTIPELETTLAILHRREMRLRPILSSALTSPENRREASLQLEALLQETRAIEDKVAKLERDQSA
jgi:hypothetical protein